MKVYGADSSDVTRKINLYTTPYSDDKGKCKCDRCRQQRKLIRDFKKQRIQ